MRVVEYDSLDRVQSELVNLAWRARIHTYAPYSGLQVGAAVMSDAGKIFTGCNVEHSLFKVIHAEQAAIVNGVISCPISNKLHIMELAIVLEANDADQHAVPCGLCCQWSREFGDDNMVIYGAKLNAKGHVWQVEIYALGELLSYSFDPNNLNK